MFWKQYVNDTICFVKIRTINYIITILNNINPNLKFTYELEKDCKYLFLDLLLIQKGGNIVTTKQRPMIFTLIGSHLLPLLEKEVH